MDADLSLHAEDSLDADSQLSAPDMGEPAETPAPSSRAESPALNTSAAFGVEPVPTPKFTVDKRINEEYKLWKKNIPFLYDTLLMTAVQFPSSTVDWIPEIEDIEDEETGESYRQQKVVLGTTARSEDDSHFNGIVIMNVRFPKSGTDKFQKLDHKTTEFKPQVGLFTGSSSSMSTFGMVSQSVPITNVRVMPQRSQLVCAKLFDSSVVVYDWKDELKNGWSYDDPIQERAPMLELMGHDTRAGHSTHGLAWNPTKFKEGHIASCDKEGKIFVWDITGLKRRSEVQPLLTITGHEAQVEDIAWHPIHPTLLGSVGLDHYCCIFDIRSRILSKPSHHIEAHTAAVNAISFAMSDVLFATSSDDTTVALWDMRNLSRKVHSLQHHTSDVFSIDWCRDVERWALIASAGADRKICIWDIRNIGVEQERLVEITTPPELVFVHGGHTGRVTDVCWNPAKGRKMMLASVAEDAIVQVWMPAKYHVWPIEGKKWNGEKRKVVEEQTSVTIDVAPEKATVVV